MASRTRTARRHGVSLAVAVSLTGAIAHADDDQPDYRVPNRSVLAAPYESDLPPLSRSRPRPDAPPRPTLSTPPWRHQLADQTDVASAFEPRKRLDLRVSIAYEHSERRGQLKREIDGAVASQSTALAFRDLSFERSRDELALRAELGIYHDLGLYLALPVVLAEQTSFRYDHTNAGSSSTVRDGIVGASGYDAVHGGGPTSGSLLFRGAQRGAAGGSGGDAFDTLDFGLRWAPFSQRRDPTKPTWLLAIEPHLSIGTIRAFDRDAPNANHGVADGVHRIEFDTAVSRRIGRFEPYVAIHYLLPIARAGSAFVQYSTAEKNTDPQHRAGGILGTEIVAYERGRPDWRVAVDLRARVEGHFQGRGYSDAWELFAGAGPLACNPTVSTNPSCDAANGKNAYQGKPFTGLTSIDGYATLGLEAAVDARLTRFLRLRMSLAWSHDESHLVTGDSAGTPATAGGKLTEPSQFNPAYRPVIDEPGRRYLVDNVDQIDFKLLAEGRF